MPGREFLVLARELLARATMPRHWRGVMVHAYYALLLECRDAITRWGLPPPTRQQVHAQVRLRLQYSTHPDLKKIGDRLEILGRHRNAASYDLGALPLVATGVEAKKDVQMASDALALLDALDTDPAQRAAAVASIRP